MFVFTFYLVFTARFPPIPRSNINLVSSKMAADTSKWENGNLPCGPRHKILIELDMSSLAGGHRVADTVELVR